MRVRELLAANAFCLLAISWAACGRFDQTVGEYALETKADPPRDEPRRPEQTATGGESGSEVASPADAGVLTPVLEDPPTSGSDPDPAGGAAGGRSSFALPPPILLDAGTPPPTGATPPACEFSVARAQRRRLDMYLMVDNNSTLPASGAWEDVRVGLDQFVNDNGSGGTGVGIRYFGLGCDPEEYAEPNVRIDVLPGNADRIVDSTILRRWTASPMLPALEGAILLQQRRAEEYPDAKQIVVLVSDALTQDFSCPYTPMDLANAARDGLREGVETHVIGVGVTTSLNEIVDEFITRFGSYNEIAAAGGSGEAIVTPLNDDGSKVREALHHVRRKATPCEFRAPAGAQNDRFGVAYYPANPGGQEIRRFGNARACGSDDGWYFATGTTSTPVHLCPKTCEWLQEADDRQIALITPCPTTP